MLLFPNLFTGDAPNQINNNGGNTRSSVAGFDTFSGAIKFLLRIFRKDRYLERAMEISSS